MKKKPQQKPKFKLDLRTSSLPWDYTKGTILCISDLHMPFHNPDSIAFLKALKDKYKPDLVVNLGDLGDFHNISFHDSDPDLPSAGEELEQLQDHARQLELLFPEMIIISSNHGDLPLRQAVRIGLPRMLFRPFNEIYNVGPGWLFIDDLTISSPKSPDLFFAHGIKKNGIALAQQRGQCVIQGHFHTEFNIHYCGNPNELLWSMMCGCLIDKKSLAFNYDKLILNRPILGTGVIVNGFPRLLPMVINSKTGRWIGEIL